MKKIIFSVALIPFLCLLTGCVGSYYYPQCVNIPLIEERGDVRLEGSLLAFPTNGKTNVVCMGHISAAGGLTDNIAAQFFFRNHIRWTDNQVSLGWYKTVGSGVLEIYCGYGNANGVRSYWSDADPDIYYSKIGYVSQYFTQINYGWNHLANSHISIAGAVKTGVLDSQIMSLHTGDEYVAGTEYPGTTSYNRSFFLEPYLSFCFGWEHLKFNIKAGYDLIRKNINTPRLMLDVGINYNFNILSGKKSK